MAMDVTGVILAGGRGARFSGEDKGLISLCGKPLVQYVMETISPQVSQIVINANRNIDRYQTLGAPVIRDDNQEFQGPLAGMAAALTHIESELALIAPCDTPFLPADLYARLYAALVSQQVDIAIPHDGEHLQPMCVLLRRSLLPAIQQALRSGHYKVRAWMKSQSHCVVDFSDNACGFININTPQELEKAALSLANTDE